MKMAIEFSLIGKSTCADGCEQVAESKRLQASQPEQKPEKQQKLISQKTFENLAVAPFEPFYLSSSNEKDVSCILKNLKNVVYNHSTPEQNSERKVLKICNFETKGKRLS